MKRSLYILVTLILLGCTYDDRQVYNPEERLMFQPSMYMHVSHDNVESFSQDMTFAVKAWSLPHGAEENTEGDEIGNKAIEFLPLSTAHCSKEIVTKPLIEERRDDLLWVIDDKVVWPSVDETLSFMGYAPATAMCSCDFNKGVTFSTDITKDQTDLLYSLPCRNRNKVEHGWIVPIQFCHALCRIDVKAKHRVESDEKITVKNIWIDAVRHKGTFTSLPTPRWQLDEDVTALNFLDQSEVISSEPQVVGHYWFVPPQTLATRITVEFEYTTAAQTSITQKLSTEPVYTQLNPGFTYTYTLSIGIDDVRFLQEILED